MNIDFDDNDKPFKYVNPSDKVIFYFEIPLNDNDQINTLQSTYDLNNFQKNKWKGLIKIYSDGTQVKIHYLRFEDVNSFKLALIVFNQYLICSIYNLVPEKDINEKKFAIHWDNNILSEEYKNIAKHIKIYSDDNKDDNKHVFTVDNIKEFAINLETLKNTNPQPIFSFNNFTNPIPSPSFNPIHNTTPTPTPSFSAPNTTPNTSFNTTPSFSAPITTPNTSFNTTPSFSAPNTTPNTSFNTITSFSAPNTLQNNLFGGFKNTGFSTGVFKSSFGGSSSK